MCNRKRFFFTFKRKEIGYQDILIVYWLNWSSEWKVDSNVDGCTA